MKKLYLVIILLFIPTWLIAGNWGGDYTTEKVKISEGIYNVIKTYTSGEVEEKIMMKIKGVRGMFEVEFVDGKYKLTEEGKKEKNKAGMSSGAC